MTLAPRPWIVAGFAHLLAAGVLGLVAAAPSALFPGTTYALVGAAGLFCLAAGFAYAFAPPLLQRAVASKTPAELALGLVLAGDAIALAFAFAFSAGDITRALTLSYGAAFVVVPAHLAWSALAGKRWTEVDLYAPQEPFRSGDKLVAWTLGGSLVMLAASGALLMVYRRHIVTPGLFLFVLGFAAPFALGLLAFLLPRAARRRLDGATMVGTAAGLFAASGVYLALAFLFFGALDMRFAAAAALLAALLGLVALRRASTPFEAVHARFLLRFGAALALLAGIGVVLALPGLAPGVLLAPATDAALASVAALLAACALLAGPLVGLRDAPRAGWWAPTAGVLAVVGVLWLASAFATGRGAFPGALVLALAAGALTWGVTPLLF